MKLEILQHTSSKYSPRTYANAALADVTIALAADLHTAGERCTKKAAGTKYLALQLPVAALISQNIRNCHADAIIDHCNEHNCHTINVAGNGIYTLVTQGYTQSLINFYVYRLLRRVADECDITHIRSGGQTGVDTAGIVAAVALGIPATALLPFGYVMRFENGKDVVQTPQQILDSIQRMVREL